MKKSHVGKVFRGQGHLCHGRVTITLSGPKGSGKALIEKLLQSVLPLTPVDEVLVIKTNDDGERA